MRHSFGDHAALLGQLLSRRELIIDNIDRRLLNARKQTLRPDSDREVLQDIVDGCFLESADAPQAASRLTKQLAAAHRTDGFEPASADGYSRELDVVELVLRAHYEWHRDRWPGRNSRVAYAQSLFAVFILQQLQYLSLRIWDEGLEPAGERLHQLQQLLKVLNAAGAAPLVRDARWLIQTAQGPLTRGLRPYFTFADRVSGSLTDRDRLEIHKAGAVLAGGHMRSQLRHRSWQTGWPFDDPQVLALTHLSNSMDMALLVRDLIPLLEAYTAACARHEAAGRPALADAILQGLSADPELLLTRLDLLASFTMIEDLFISRDGRPGFTELGEAHRARVTQYRELIGRAAEPLRNDAMMFNPSHATYSPLGMIYGFCADLLSNMVLVRLRSSSRSNVSLEEMFDSRALLEEKRIVADQWGSLPKAEGERDAFEYSREWANEMFARMSKGLEARAARPTDANASGCAQARLYVVSRGIRVESLPDGVIPNGIVSAQEHCLTADVARAREMGSTALPSSRLSDDRSEGRFLASTNDNGWFAVSKALLTTCISRGKDALVTDVPPDAIDVLRLVCPEILVVPQP